MGCGCSSAFDGEDQAKFEEGFDFVNDSNSVESNIFTPLSLYFK